MVCVSASRAGQRDCARFQLTDALFCGFQRCYQLKHGGGVCESDKLGIRAFCTDNFAVADVVEVNAPSTS
ncbi:hypothetical protein [Cronobacter sakazakii]|uniref:hypothetical protein n=1 Tax=Cronobacter sakazakii TaxID=28141 RepID=UPI0015E48751|nr:hypothetical protein [Cronobacter sakazakii]ELY2762291.1 hypothetical protein [Cronobacter sakazakii]ELY3986065.1 hypothetical protein [Cronobacter sakazakii]